MIFFAAALLFGLFLFFYIFMISACVWQENELSLPHEKAVGVTILILIISVMLITLALYSFLQIDWNNLLISSV
jgi:hypothetical protein